MLKNFNKNYQNNQNISIFTRISYHSENQPIVFLQICCVWPAWLNKKTNKKKPTKNSVFTRTSAFTLTSLAA
jgi:hypothetical protein